MKRKVIQQVEGWIDPTETVPLRRYCDTIDSKPWPQWGTWVYASKTPRSRWTKWPPKRVRVTVEEIE